MAVLHYLQDKLSKFDINSIDDLKKAGYLKAYRWLCDTYQGISHNTLWDLYCLTNDLPINSLNEQIRKNILDEYKNMLPSYPPLKIDEITTFLGKAVDQAAFAIQCDEVPIGSVIVKDNFVISSAFNYTKTSCDITAHSEIVAIRGAQEVLNNFRLDGCDLYVTIEPCLMCAGSIINSRIRRLIYGAIEPKTGAITSQYQVFNNKQVNHHTEVIGPIDNAYYSSKVKEFFLNRR